MFFSSHDAGLRLWSLDFILFDKNVDHCKLKMSSNIIGLDFGSNSPDMFSLIF